MLVLSCSSCTLSRALLRALRAPSCARSPRAMASCESRMPENIAQSHGRPAKSPTKLEESEGGALEPCDNWADLLSNKRYWGVYFLIIVGICVAGVGYFGGVAHSEIPPLCDFEGPDGKVHVSADMIKHGEEVFHLRGLMSYGTFLGDGAERGPDYTAEALHIMAVSMAKYYKGQGELFSMESPADRDAAIANRVRVELRNNAHDAKRDVVVLNAAQLYAFADVAEHYRRTYQDRVVHKGSHPNSKWGQLSLPPRVIDFLRSACRKSLPFIAPVRRPVASRNFGARSASRKPWGYSNVISQKSGARSASGNF